MRKIIPVLTAAVLTALATGPAFPQGNPSINRDTFVGLENRLLALEDLAPRYVFVTSTGHNGNFAAVAGAVDGLDGADIVCQGLADSVNAIVPIGTYKAWLSTPSVDAKDRIDLTSGAYVRSDGSVVADNSTDLLDGTLDLPISKDEGGFDKVTAVWTGTDGNGEFFVDPNVPPRESDCGGWATADPNRKGLRGLSVSTGIDWTRASFNSCTPVNPAGFSLYCFQVLGGP